MEFYGHKTSHITHKGMVAGAVYTASWHDWFHERNPDSLSGRGFQNHGRMNMAVSSYQSQNINLRHHEMGLQQLLLRTQDPAEMS